VIILTGATWSFSPLSVIPGLDPIGANLSYLTHFRHTRTWSPVPPFRS
jgi:hypothetical protein